MVSELAAQVLDVLTRHRDGALFLAELRACLGQAELARLEPALAELNGARVLVVDHHSPDEHLQGDLRVVALVPAGSETGDGLVAAHRAAELAWSRWLREVLAQHRCG